MELIACTCAVGLGLPHDHYIEPTPGRELPHNEPNDVGHLWVDWKAVARAQMLADPGSLLATA